MSERHGRIMLTTTVDRRRRPASAITTLTLVVGVVLLIAAVAGFVIVPEHGPGSTAGADVVIPGTNTSVPAPGPVVVYGWSQTVYDAARIGTRAALIVGAVLVVLGLIRFARRPV